MLPQVKYKYNKIYIRDLGFNINIYFFILNVIIVKNLILCGFLNEKYKR